MRLMNGGQRNPMRRPRSSPDIPTHRQRSATSKVGGGCDNRASKPVRRGPAKLQSLKRIRSHNAARIHLCTTAKTADRQGTGGTIGSFPVTNLIRKTNQYGSSRASPGAKHCNEVKARHHVLHGMLRRTKAQPLRVTGARLKRRRSPGIGRREWSGLLVADMELKCIVPGNQFNDVNRDKHTTGDQDQPHPVRQALRRSD
jgi:hypothetical protein